MDTTTITSPIRREPELVGQTVVVIGGSSDIRAGNSPTSTRRRSSRHPDRP